MIKSLIKNVLKKRMYNSSSNAYIKYYKKVIENNPEILKNKVEGETEWLNRWKKYDKNLSTLSYRVFSYYIGEDINIFPLELCRNLVERTLTPSLFSSYYSDKNSLGKIVPSYMYPIVHLRNIRGHFFTGDYNQLVDNMIEEKINKISSDRIILKPSRLDSGIGVTIFTRKNGFYYNSRNECLTYEFLKSNYNIDYLIQDCLEQSEFTSRFNPTSVNTIRIATYRDINGLVHPLKAVLRIGAKGASVDNSHSGGVACGIDENGKLGKYICNIYGVKQNVFNGIDFENNNFIIPHFKELQNFAVKVSSCVLHHDLVALDIALDKNNNPRLIEINTYGFAGWIFQLLSGSIFGEFTDEVIERSFNKKDKLDISLLYALK